MILHDQETTGLIKNSVIAIGQQPEMIEFGAIKVNDETLEVVGELNFFCRPSILPISDEVRKITGITTDMVKGEKPFVAYLPRLTKFFLGEKVWVAHNQPFDRDILIYELRRLGKEHFFPYPPTQVCTAELSNALLGKYYKLEELRKLTSAPERMQTHRALDDVYDLLDVVRWLRKEHGAI